MRTPAAAVLGSSAAHLPQDTEFIHVFMQCTTHSQSQSCNAGSVSWAAMGTVVRTPTGALLATVVGSLGTACSDVVVDSIVVERSRNAPQVHFRNGKPVPPQALLRLLTQTAHLSFSKLYSWLKTCVRLQAEHGGLAAVAVLGVCRARWRGERLLLRVSHRDVGLCRNDIDSL